jgi:hypothetical protein
MRPIYLLGKDVQFDCKCSSRGLPVAAGVANISFDEPIAGVPRPCLQQSSSHGCCFSTSFALKRQLAGGKLTHRVRNSNIIRNQLGSFCQQILKERISLLLTEFEEERRKGQNWFALLGKAEGKTGLLIKKLSSREEQKAREALPAGASRPRPGEQQMWSGKTETWGSADGRE